MLLQLSTGAGKTAIFSTVLKSANAKGKKCVMVVRGRQLVDQASKRLDALEVPHGVLMAAHKRYDLGQNIQVASIDTCQSRGIYPKADIVVIDEAHYAVSDSFKEFLTHYNDAYWLSVTATPWSKDGLQHLASDVVYPISIRNLIEQGWLAPAKYFVPSNFDASKIESQNGEFKDSSSILQMEEQKIHGDIIDNYAKRCTDGRTFVFAVNITHANELSSLFFKSGFSNQVITGETPIDDRNTIIQNNNLIISIGTLTTGVDVPDLKNIILARPTRSRNLYIQMLGRGTRIFPGKSHFTIYDHVGNVQRHGFIEDEEKADLKPIEVKKSKVGEAPVKVCACCMAVMAMASKVCAECGTEIQGEEKAYPIKGKGDLKEVKALSEQERELNKFKLTCSKLLAKAWGKGYKYGWMNYEILKKYDQDTFRKYSSHFYHFIGIYKAWEKAGKNDTGQPKGYKNYSDFTNVYTGDTPWK